MDEFERAAAALKGQFLVRLVAERAELVAASDDADRAVLHALAHRLAGSAGVFGFPELSRQAAALQRTLRDESARGAWAEQTRHLVAQIDAALDGR